MRLEQGTQRGVVEADAIGESDGNGNLALMKVASGLSGTGVTIPRRIRDEASLL